MNRAHRHLALVSRPTCAGARVPRAIGRLRDAARGLTATGEFSRAAVVLVCAAASAAVGYWPPAVFCGVLGVAEAFLAVRTRIRRGGGGRR